MASFSLAFTIREDKFYIFDPRESKVPSPGSGDLSAPRQRMSALNQQHSLAKEGCRRYEVCTAFGANAL
jgi:hypothetical protein